MTTVSFQLPDDIEQQLRHAFGDVNAVAKEAALVELYRQGQLSHGKLAESLELSRYETDAVLKQHHVVEDLLTRDEFESQINHLRNSLGQ